VHLVGVHLTGMHLMSVHLTGVHLMGVHYGSLPVNMYEVYGNFDFRDFRF
jgi:hypothetical protein